MLYRPVLQYVAPLSMATSSCAMLPAHSVVGSAVTAPITGTSAKVTTAWSLCASKPLEQVPSVTLKSASVAGAERPPV